MSGLTEPGAGASSDGQIAGRNGDDRVQPFLLESSGIRGRLLRLGGLADLILGRQDYPDPLAVHLGEMLALTGALSSLIKYDGVFTLQARGNGPVNMMIADVTDNGDLRGYAGFDREAVAKLLSIAGQDNPGSGLRAFMGKGQIAYTVDLGDTNERYQGIVELSGDSLADCLQHYFLASEQIRSGILCAAGRVSGQWRASALVLQRLPEEEGQLEVPDEDAWRRSMILQASCTNEELLDPKLSAHDLLYRLFHEEGVRVFEPRVLTGGCRCSREKLAGVLVTLPQAEVMDLRIDGRVSVTCEFCNSQYDFDDQALKALFAASPASAG
ncbi:MAG: Hsp33 family molecular chaperone HslO [Pseudomonadota bacterium]